jgi:hypothetical protein
MKRIVFLSLATIVLAMMSVSYSDAQAANSQSSTQPQSQTPSTPEPSLGSYARTLRKDKKDATTKTFDNDNLPREDKLSVVGEASGSADSSASADAGPSDSQADSKSAAGDKVSKMPSVTPGQSQEDRQQVYDQWKTKLTNQQGEIDQLARELDLTQREYKLRAAAMYGDAGDRLRNQAQWDKEDADYKKRLADDQKALDDAKQKLSDLQEDARRSGVPTSVREGDQSSTENAGQNQNPQHQ